METADWRDKFCGRSIELGQLLERFEQVVHGEGPRIAVVLGDRGMGKTRLIQEFYRVLSDRFDPDDYWPDPAIFARRNLRVAPDMEDVTVRAHYQSFALADRPMPFLWWGFRLSDPDVRNAAVSGMSAHRSTLDPHLEPFRFARQIGAMRKDMKDAGIDAASEFGKNILKEAVKIFPGGSVAITVTDLLVDYAGKAKKAAEAARAERQLRQAQQERNLLNVHEGLAEDLVQATLDDIAALFTSVDGSPTIPCVVFCDDAQFARPGGDEGTLRFLEALWQRAHLSDWPLFIIFTHWSFEWFQPASSASGPNCAAAFSTAANSAQFGLLIELPKEPSLDELVRSGLPGIPAEDVALLLERADGNPQVLIELVELVRRSPAWIRPDDRRLTTHARRQIEAQHGGLADLIFERLQSDSTPVSVRQAAALSSVQGMEFLCRLTKLAAASLDLTDADRGLIEAQLPHRLIDIAESGVASFAQRAYRDAALRLLSGQVGDPEEVAATLVRLSIDVFEDDAQFRGLRRQEQLALWAVLAELGQDLTEPEARRYAGLALLRLVKALMDGDRGADFARAAQFAKRFEAGLDGRWSLEQFDLAETRVATLAIEAWLGPQQAGALAERQLLRSREMAAINPSALALGEVYVQVSESARLAQDSGDWLLAERHYREALAIARSILVRSSSTDALREVATALNLLAWAVMGRALMGEATAMFEDALLLRRTLNTMLETERSRRDLSMSLTNYGIVLQEAGDWTGAGRLFSECLAIRESLAAARPDIQQQLDLSDALDRVGGIELQRGDFDRAKVYFTRSHEIRQTYAGQQSSLGLRFRVARSLANLGEVAEARGHWLEAADYMRQAVAVRRALWERQRTAGAHGDLLTDLNKLGRIARAMSDWLTAKAVYKETVESGRALVAMSNSIVYEHILSTSLHGLGLTLKAEHRVPEAETCFQEYLTIWRRIAPSLGAANAQAGLLSALEAVADVTEFRGDFENARRLREEALDIARQIGSDGSLPPGRRRLSISLNRLGGLLVKMGDPSGATDRIQESIHICRSLVRDVPSLTMSDLLGDALQELGKLHLSTEEWGPAAVLLRESTAIRLEIARARQDTADWSRYIGAVMLFGTALEQLEEWDEALPLYADCLATIRDLDLSGPQSDQVMGLALLKAADAESHRGNRDSALQLYRDGTERLRKLQGEGRRYLALCLMQWAVAGGESESREPTALRLIEESRDVFRELWEAYRVPTDLAQSEMLDAALREARQPIDPAC